MVPTAVMDIRYKKKPKDNKRGALVQVEVSSQSKESRD